MKKSLAAAALLAVFGVAHAEPITYGIDPSHTFVYFEISHFGTSSNRARFDKKEGQVQFDRVARSGRAEITIDMNSVSSGVPPFDRHLKSKDIFDAETYPQAKFVGDKFTFEGDKVTQVSGTLTMKGQTHPLTLKASNFNCYTSPMLKREVCGGDFQATLQRSQWGLAYGLPVAAPDTVRLLVQIEAVKQ